MPTETKVPNRLVASGSPVIIRDLGVTIGATEVNLKASGFNDKQVKNSSDLKKAFSLGLVVAAPKPVVSVEEQL